MKKKLKNFLVLSNSDMIVLKLLAKHSPEFSKLDVADQKVLIWYITHAPERVASWCEYLCESYSREDRRCINFKSLLLDIDEINQTAETFILPHKVLQIKKA